MNWLNKMVVVCLGVVLLIPGLAFAQEGSPDQIPEVGRVEIRGNKLVNASLIRKHLKTRAGSPFSRIDVNNDIKRLYRLNYFSEIDVVVDDLEAFTVTFVVSEKPVVDRIIFRGNRKIKIKQLRGLLKLIEGQLLNEKVLAQDVVSIKDHYAGKGYKQITVDSQTKVNEEGSLADIILNINEGKKTRIKKINILGASQVKEKKILRVMKTRRKRLLSSGFFDESKFLEDLERIKAFYYQKGYIDIKVKGYNETLVDDNSRVIIDIEIEEGHLYRIGELELEGNITFSEEELFEESKIQERDFYLPQNLQKEVKRLRNIYFRRGFIDARVGVKTYIEEDPEVLSIRFSIQEGQEAFVDKIIIKGNEKTRDVVIRRELNIKPGEKYDGVRMDIAQRRLNNLRLFKQVDVYPDPTSQEKERDLFIEVQEDQTGELSFGAGFSSVDDLIGFLELTQSNFDFFNPPYFTGDGQKLKLHLEFGSRKKEFLVDFTEPWLFGKKLLYGLSLFRRDRDFKGSDFSEDRQGIATRLAKPLFEYVRGELKYTFENVEVNNVSDNASIFLQAQEGERDVGKLAVTLTRDVRNSVFFATRGSRNRLVLEVAGVGGDTEYLRGIYSLDKYFGLWMDHVLITSFRVGAMEEYGDSEDVPIFDRFFLGGPWSVRGFENRDLGPHDDFREPLGGKFMYYGTLEYVIPLAEKFQFATFCDIGRLYQSIDSFEDSDLEIDQTNGLNGSVGVGIRVQLPIGPIRFDYAWPVITDDFHEGANAQFSFDLGQRF